MLTPAIISYVITLPATPARRPSSPIGARNMSDPRTESVPIFKILNAFYVDGAGKIRNSTARGRSAANAISGRIMRDGYRQIKFESQLYQGSRIAWVIHHKEWPARRIDFINGDRDDHRPCNLRTGRNDQVFSNRGPIRGKALPKGVTAHPGGRYQAQIKHVGKYIYIGLFDSPDLAKEAYDKEEKHLFGAFRRNADLAK